jgi:hypothetical protein
MVCQEWKAIGEDDEKSKEKAVLTRLTFILYNGRKKEKTLGLSLLF